MVPEKLAQTTSSELSEEKFNGTACAKIIHDLGWWQGSIIADADLRQKDQKLPIGASHWVLASQTCNLFNNNFEKVRLVEWVGIQSINEREVNDKVSLGMNPRLLHVYTSSSPENKSWFCCDIQLRHWTERETLANLQRPQTSLIDAQSGLNHEQQKDLFVRWIARSYTRLELSNELNKAIDKAKIGLIIERLLEKHKDDIYGIFIDLGDAKIPVAEIRPDCDIEFSFIIHSESKEELIKKLIDEELKREVDNPDYASDKKVIKKITRLEVIKRQNLRFAYQVRTTSNWNISDIENTIRYSLVDHLSDSTEIKEE